MQIDFMYDYQAELVQSLELEKLAKFVLDQAEGLPKDTAVSISFVTDEKIAELNEAYRGKQGPTDVLSFECDGADFDTFDAEDGIEFELGDVIIAPDVALRQTHEFGTTLAEEFQLLLTHGLLHLCGFDHIEDDEALEMEALEKVLLEAFAQGDSAPFTPKFMTQALVC